MEKETVPDNLIFLQCVPKDIYFIWQLSVQITNFRKFNISGKMEIIVWYPKGYNDWKEWRKLETTYPEVKFFYYEDEGVDLDLYIPQLRPHSLKKHFKKHSDRLKGKIFFYHDSDVIFNYLPDFHVLCSDDVCWQSDCSSYLDYSYMRRKEEEGGMLEEEGIKEMAEIGGITAEIIKSYDGNTGGAQNILKNINSEYWQDVEKMCADIRRKFWYGVKESINNKYFTSEASGWQSWTCDMWAVNFALWKRGIKTQITDKLAFSWATDTWDVYLQKPIMHNAGITSSKTGLFYKGEWINKSPIGQNLPNPPLNSASRAYINAINDVK